MLADLKDNPYEQNYICIRIGVTIEHILSYHIT